MNELISKKLRNRDYINNMTMEMDEHLLDGWKANLEKGYSLGTYICDVQDGKSRLAIRFPGATRGHIELDKDMVITNIVFYTSAYKDCVSCYKPSIEKLVNKYIGFKFVVEK